MGYLDQFVDLCWDPKCLENIAGIYKGLCSADNILNHTFSELNWQVLFGLKSLVFCEENNKVIKSVLDGYNNLFDEHDFGHDEIDKIVGELYEKRISVNLERKIKKMNVIFDGFLRKNMDEEDYMPTDIKLLIFAYFNGYQNKSYDILSRLLFLMDVGNGYSDQIRNKSILCLTKITQYCAENVSITLCKDKGALNVIKEILNEEQKTCVDDEEEEIEWNDLYWIVTNIAYDCFEYVWHSNILKAMINKFNNESFVNQGQMMWPLCDLICRIADAEVIIDILLNHGIIDGFVRFLDNGLIFSETNTKTIVWRDVFSKIFDLFEYILSIEKTKPILIMQIREFGGVSILKDVKDNHLKLNVDIGNQQRLRLISLLADYFEINEVDDEKTSGIRDDNANNDIVIGSVPSNYVSRHTNLGMQEW